MGLSEAGDFSYYRGEFAAGTGEYCGTIGVEGLRSQRRSRDNSQSSQPQETRKDASFRG
jgi:hypothetical protein